MHFCFYSILIVNFISFLFSSVLIIKIYVFFSLIKQRRVCIWLLKGSVQRYGLGLKWCQLIGLSIKRRPKFQQELHIGPLGLESPVKLKRQLVQELAILRSIANRKPISTRAFFTSYTAVRTGGVKPLENHFKGRGKALKDYMSFLTVSTAEKMLCAVGIVGLDLSCC